MTARRAGRSALLLFFARAHEIVFECDLPRIRWSADDERLCMPEEPFIIEFEPARQGAMAQLTTRTALMSAYGNASVLVTSSNQFSQNEEALSLREYIDSLSCPVVSQRADENRYLFGGNEAAFESLLRNYIRPPGAYCDDDDTAAIAFGVGGERSGVSWHMHGAGYSEVLHGRKTWLVADSWPEGSDSPNTSTFEWIQRHAHTEVRQLAAATSSRSTSRRNVRVCTLEPGEALAFPAGKPHATVNVDDFNVFVSTFLREPDDIDPRFSASHCQDPRHRLDWRRSAQLAAVY